MKEKETTAKSGQAAAVAGPGEVAGVPAGAAAPAKTAALANGNRPQQLTALRLFEGHTGTVCGLTISPDGKRVVSCSGRPFGDCTMRLWDIASGKEIRRLNADTLPVLPSHTQLRDPPGDIQRVTFAPDGRHVLFGGANGLLGLWDVDTGRVARRFVGHTIYVDGVAVSRDGKRVLSAGTEGTVRLWDMATGKELQRMAGHTDAPASVAFSSDGTRALSGSRDHTMRLWDLRKGEQIGAPFPGHPHMVLWTVVFLPDGQQAISCDSTIRLWDLTRDLPTGRQLRTFDAHTAPVLDVALSSDGRRILSGSVDGTARLWDRFTGREIATLVGHRNWIQAVALTPDGRFALTSGGAEGRAPPYRPGNDFALRLWRLP